MQGPHNPRNHGNGGSPKCRDLYCFKYRHFMHNDIRGFECPTHSASPKKAVARFKFDSPHDIKGDIVGSADLSAWYFRTCHCSHVMCNGSSPNYWLLTEMSLCLHFHLRIGDWARCFRYLLMHDQFLRDWLFTHAQKAWALTKWLIAHGTWESGTFSVSLNVGEHIKLLVTGYSAFQII